MKQTALQSPTLTPVIQAALLRRSKPRVRKAKSGAEGGEKQKKSLNNYIAKPNLTAGKQREKARRPGAPEGNSNAVRSGWFRAEAQEARRAKARRFRAMHAVVRDIETAIILHQPVDTLVRRFRAFAGKVAP